MSIAESPAPVANHRGDPISRLVQETWAELLGLDALGPDDDFFELGGHSLMAAGAVARLGERLGLDLPPLALFEAPTAREMAELVAEVRDGRRPHPDTGVTPFRPAWVIPLQREGSGRPVFVFPAGHHELTALTVEARVAAHVGREHPFWGFGRDDPQLDRARAGGVVSMAAEYVAQMRTIQGKGPYLLYANCAGGAYAWEAARQLLAAGDGIAGILFFEVALDSALTSPGSGVTPAHVSAPPVAPEHYRPPPLPVDLTLLMTRFWQERRWSDAWQRVALGSAETVVIPGETETAFDHRDERIARHVHDWIEQAEARLHDG